MPTLLTRRIEYSTGNPMSLVNEFRSTEAQIKELQAHLKSLSENDGLKKELEFETKLRALMAEYQKSLPSIIAILDPQAKAGKVARVGKTGTKRARKMKQYKNPNTGDVIETKGGNHKVLKEWKAKWGSDLVESWVTLLD
jgi:hypothetical protein